jgi:hypothetical protein
MDWWRLLMNWQIDAFTDRAYIGNPAVVLILPNERDDKWLQLIAREFNLSKIAFLVKRSNTQKGRGFVQIDESGRGLKATKTYGPQSMENELNLRWSFKREGFWDQVLNIAHLIARAIKCAILGISLKIREYSLFHPFYIHYMHKNHPFFWRKSSPKSLLDDE